MEKTKKEMKKDEIRQKLLDVVREEFYPDSAGQVDVFIKNFNQDIFDHQVNYSQTEYSADDYLKVLKKLLKEKQASEYLQNFSLTEFVLLNEEKKTEKISEIRNLKKGLKNLGLRNQINDLISEIKASETKASVLIRELEAVEVSFVDLDISMLESFKQRISLCLKHQTTIPEQHKILDLFLEYVEEALTERTISIDRRY